MAETGSMVENLKGRVRTFFRAQYCLVAAATAERLWEEQRVPPILSEGDLPKAIRPFLWWKLTHWVCVSGEDALPLSPFSPTARTSRGPWRAES